MAAELATARQELQHARSERDSLAQRFDEQAARHAEAMEAARLERDRLASQLDTLGARTASYAQTLELVTALKEQNTAAVAECEGRQS